MKMNVFYIVALIILALASWLVVGFLWGFPGSGWQIVRLIAFLLTVLALALAFKRLSAKVRIYTGLLILVGLFLPASIIVAHPSFKLPGQIQTLLETMLFFIPSLALVSAALLLHSGINRYQEWQAVGKVEDGGSRMLRKQAGRTTAILLVLSVLLLAKTFQTLYWLTVWDNANDSIGYILVFVPVLAVFYSGAMLYIMLPGRAKWTGLLFALSITAMLIAVSTRAQGVDFNQLTEERAGQVSQAIESYYSRQGSYPQNLRQLIPRYTLLLPEPVIIYGQDWCYEGDVDYYRLGYIYRDHWSSPILIGHIYKTKGQASDSSQLCDTEIATLRKSYPDYPWEYSMEGK